MKRITRALILLAFMATPLAVHAVSRDLLVHQGFVSDSAGNPVSGQFSVTFRMYSALTGGQALWEETTTVTADNGIFNAELGSTTPFPADLFNQDNLYLGVQFAGDQEMTPRLGLYSIPWAQQSEVAVTALSLANDAITSQNIAPDSIDATDIAPGSIGSDELSSSGVAAGTYTVASITVDEDGRIVAASNGSSGGTGDITGILAGPGLLGGGASGEITLSSILGDAIDSSEITDGTITAADLNPAIALNDNQVDDDLTISGGAIDGTVIGATTPEAGTFTALTLSGSAPEFRLMELGSNGSDYIGFAAPDSIDSSQIWTLPAQDGSSGQALTTDGTGNLAWSTPAGGDITGVIAGSGLAGGGTSGSVTLSVDGSSIAGLNASNVATGTLSDSRLSANVSLLGSSIEAGEIAGGGISDSHINASAGITWSKINKSGANAADVGAAPLGHGHTAAEVGAAPASHAHSSGDISGSFDDSQVSDSLTLDGSTINNSVIGASMPQPGTFTSITGTQSLFLEDPLAGANRIHLQAPDNLAAPYSLRLPANDGDAGQVLATDGNGELSFTDAAAGDVTGVTAGSGLTGGGAAGEVTLSVDGPNLTGLNASNLAAGTVDDARLSSNVSFMGSSVDSSEITDGTLTNSDINASAAIAWNKIDKSGASAADVGAAALAHSHTAVEVGAAPAVHGHVAGDISGMFSSSQIPDDINVGPTGSVDDAALPANISRLGSSVDSSEITDGSLTSADLSASAGMTDAQVNDNLTVIGGSIENTAIGASNPAAGTFTALTGTSSLNLEDPQTGTNAVTLQAPDNLSAAYSLRLPAGDGENGQALITDGNGALNWTDLSTATGDITGVTAGAGLAGGGTSGNLTLSVDGPSITGLNSSNIASGTLDDARLSPNVSLLGTAIDSSEITDATLTDSDINTSAGIAWGKISKAGSSPADVGAAALIHSHTAAEVGAAPVIHSHSALDISGEFDDAQVSDMLTVGAGSFVDDSALSSNVSFLGAAVDSSEVTDGSLMGADLNSNAGLTDAQVNNDLTISGGTVENTVIGSGAPAAGTFTDVAGRNSFIFEDPTAGTNAVTMQAPDGLSAGYALRLPADDGTSGQALVTDGSGALSWTDLSSATGDITSVTAGAGLTGGGADGDVTLNLSSNVSLLGPSIDSSEIANGSVTDADIDASAGIAWSKIDTTGSNLSTFGPSVDSAEITDGAITNADISASAGIAFSKISGAAAALHTHSASDLSGGTIADLLLSPNVSLLGQTIESSEIADGTLTGADIAANTVAGTHIALGSDSQGDLMYYNGTDWARLPAGNAGQILKTNGVGANPAWTATAMNLEFYESNIPVNGPNTANDCMAYTNTGTAAGRLGRVRLVSLDGFTRIRLIARANTVGAQGQPTMRIQDMTAGAPGTTLVTLNSGWTNTCATQTATANIALTGVRKLECQEFGAAANDDPAYSHCAIELLH